MCEILLPKLLAQWPLFSVAICKVQILTASSQKTLATALKDIFVIVPVKVSVAGAQQGFLLKGGGGLGPKVEMFSLKIPDVK